ncbi:helix-turn-helix domain-containing protein [Streptomyces sp. NPDC095614]|uniref:helix-turn-helix domain-containing protein n=1 Tax=Streptomyces sp. NPDC095614 TaxID=3156692 RepID=UPI00332C814A
MPVLTQTAAPPERFLRAQEVADWLNVHVSTVYRLADSGRLRAHRLGEGRLRKRGLRVPESAVTEYLAGSIVTSSEVAA